MNRQSPDIAQCVDTDDPDNAGAGDQGAEPKRPLCGMKRGESPVSNERGASAEARATIANCGVMYGYATNETEEMLPLPCVLAHRITRLLMISRVDNVIDGLLPDGKAQVTVEYKDDIPVRVDSVVVSAQARQGKHEGRTEVIRSAFSR